MNILQTDGKLGKKCRVGGALLALLASVCVHATDSRPNVLLIMADDLGYSDIGAFGGEIDTPHLDALIQRGRHLAAMYVAPACSPTRAMLLSGMDHHLAGVGNMAEFMALGFFPEHMGVAGYEGALNHHVASLPELLRDSGYRTLMAGKWHLGLADGRRPQQRGFEHSWALMDGGSAHFKQSGPMRHSTWDPTPTYRENDRVIELPDDFYSSRTYTGKLIDYLEQTRDEGKPFFAYLAYTAPHWPIQAPDDLLAKYRGRYDQGYDAIAAARLARIKALGLTAADTPLVPMPDGVKPWARLNASERAHSARTMEVYAAAVEAMDRQIGRLVEYLDSSGQLDNTLIVFLSDNGPDGARMDARPGMSEWMQENFDMSLDNMGRANSYVFQGPAWGQVSALPFRYFKAHAYEGGIRSAAFVVLPGRIAAGRGNVQVTVMDIMPTILDLAGIKHPGISYQGRNILPMRGMSMLPWLEGRASSVHAADIPLGFELMGRASLRKGDWKIVHQSGEGTGTWALYYLRDDPSELHDLSVSHSDKLDELLIEWMQHAQHNNVIFSGRVTMTPRNN